MKHSVTTLMAFIVAAILFSQCTGGKQPAEMPQVTTDSDSVSTVPDSTVYGVALESGMSAIYMRTNNGDTLEIDKDDEKGYGDIYGYSGAGGIADNNYNLSVSTYVEKEDTKEKIDIKELNAKIKDIVAHEDVLRKEIDKIIEDCLTNYSIKRLNLVDKAIIELCVSEMLNGTNPKIAINEALEITKLYTDQGDKKAVSFKKEKFATIQTS